MAFFWPWTVLKVGTCKALEDNTCLIIVLNFSHPQTVHSPGRLCMGGRRADNSTAGVPGYPSGKHRTVDSFCVTYSGSVRSRMICVIKWRTFYKSFPGLWTEQCFTSLPTLPAAPGIVLVEYPTFENLGRSLPLSLYVSITQHPFKCSTAALPDLKMQVFSKSHGYLPVLYFGSATTLQMTMGTCVSALGPSWCSHVCTE